jgi:hypothetical protein
MALRSWFLIGLPSFLAIAACNGDGGSLAVVTVPRGAALPPIAITLTPTYDGPAGFLPRPARFDGHIYLRVDQEGIVTGALSVDSTGEAFLAPVDGRIDGDSIVLTASAVDSAASEQLQWDVIRVSLLDQDGDGAIDGAVGDARGTFRTASTELSESSPYAASISATKDTTGTAVDFAELDPRLPFGVVPIAFAEPVRADQVTASLRVLAGGRPVAGTFDATPVDGLITRARFQPADFLPFDQAISLDVGALTDPAGNAITAAASALHVVPDPSAATNNLGFEHGLTGWSVVGHAASVGSFGGLAPVEGSSQAVVDAVGTLAGYIDVPSDAETLHVSIARLSYLPEVESDYTAAIALHRANGETIASFDARDATEKVVPCAACGPAYGFQLGPLTRDLDLTSMRGERVWLTVEARAFFFIGVPALAVVVDDLRVVTSN